MSIIDINNFNNYIYPMNDAIKNAIISFLEKKGLLTETTYKELNNDADKLKSLREDIDDEFLKLKINIIKSNIMLLNERIFKDDVEGALQVLINTKDKTVFYDYIDSLNNLLIKLVQYDTSLGFDSPELKTIKENFFLKDEELVNIINEIYLDNK